MFLLELDGSRRVARRIERRLVVRCQSCGNSLPCPEAEDFWVWLESAEVEAFKQKHEKITPLIFPVHED
jgi:predicted aldo/keto reductase-like oxidoreductase